jgi:aspartate aminotransferase
MNTLQQITYSDTSDQGSRMASKLVGSEILKIAGDIRAMVAQGKTICNLTVGDFSPKHFPIPELLRTALHEAIDGGETNYPPSDGIPQLRKAIRDFYERRLGLDVPAESIVVTGGARPAIYAAYRALVDPNEAVVYPVPSWNNNHYVHLSGTVGVPIPCSAKNAFLPTRANLAPVLSTARMLSLCSPLNPTGTAFTVDALRGICEAVLEENERRQATDQRPLYLAYDQVYWMLTFGSVEHHHPLELYPELADVTIYIDGISKWFASTGLRVGWLMAPPHLAARMSNLLGHVGAWAPRPEQVATAKLLANDEAIDQFHATMIPQVEMRLRALYDGVEAMKDRGLPVDSIEPMGAIYLTARFNLIGKKAGSKTINTNEEVRRYLLEEAGVAIIPFQAFGTWENDGWFRLSVGAVSMDEIATALPRIEAAISKLS